jgi:hypothetical protein
LRYVGDPVELFLQTIPRIAGTARLNDAALEVIDGARRELENIEVGYQSLALQAVRETLSLDRDAGNALERAEEWAACFPDATLPKNGLEGLLRALLQNARQANSGRHTEASFARALSTLLISKDFHQWDDRTPRQFAVRLRETAEQIERAALQAEAPDPRLKPLVESRMRGLFNTMQKMADPADIAALVREFTHRAEEDNKDETKDGYHGDPKLRAS